MRVIVLLGGDSCERDVSQVTGRAVAAALRRKGHDVVALDTGTGRSVDFEGGPAIGAEPPATGALVPLADPLHTVQRIGGQAFGEVDVVFVALHGQGGEDGTMQALLELVDIPYTGSGVMASSVAMDKEMSRHIFRDLGIPIAPGFYTEANAPLEMLAERVRAECGFPVVVKPNSQGSSVGVHIVERPGELALAIEDAAQYDSRLGFETFIPGRELTVAVVEDRALPVIEIRTAQGFYDYRSKYTPGNTQYEVPANMPDAVASKVQEYALAAFLGLRCRDFARVDFRLSPENQPYCLEVNTIPGMTPASLVPKAARAAGLDFDSLVDRLVRLAATRGKLRSGSRR